MVSIFIHRKQAFDVYPQLYLLFLEMKKASFISNNWTPEHQKELQLVTFLLGDLISLGAQLSCKKIL